MTALRSTRLDPQRSVQPQQGLTLDRRLPQTPRQPVLPSDRLSLPIGKPSTLKLGDLRDRLALSPQWKQRKFAFPTDPDTWDLNTLKDMRERLKGMLSELRQKGLEGQEEYRELADYEQQFSRLIEERRGDPRTVLEACLKLVLHPSAWEARLQGLRQEALQCMRAQRFGQAKRLLKTVLHFKEDPLANEALGRCYYAEGNLKDAKQHLERATQFSAFSPTRVTGPSAFILLGKISHELGDRTAAKNAFGQAMLLDPNHAEPYSWLGVLAYEEGQTRESLHLLQRSISLDPLNSAARYYLAQISLQHNDLLRANFQMDFVKKIEPRFEGRIDPSRALPAAPENDHFYEPHRWVLPAS